MLETYAQYVLLIGAILFLVMLAQRMKIAYPVVLVVGGLAWSLFAEEVLITLKPELIFVIFLPPLLYEAAWNTSWKDFWRWRRVIFSFAFLIVFFTSLVVAIVSSHLLPGFTLALGFLLGAVVSPPDAVSATTIMRSVKVPKRILAIAEGESLMNDASSLIVFRFALIAVDTGRFVFYEAAWDFVVVVTMGILTGLLIALIYYAIHRWLPTTPTIDIVFSFTTPYMMYIAAEMFHFSGVLSVVAGGLFLSEKGHIIFNPRTRLSGGSVWSTVGFLLNGLVFIIIGLELPIIVEQLGPLGLATAIRYGLLITAVLIVTRILSTLGASAFTVFISRFITTADSRPGWKGPLIFGWAGMRGVVSLAAALSIPLTLSSGEAFPQRSLIIFVTFTVILFTLIIQGLTLPWLIRWLDLPDPDFDLSALEQEQMIRTKIAERSMQFLEQQSEYSDNRALQQLRTSYQLSQQPPNESTVSEQEAYCSVHLRLLSEQRIWLKEINRKIKVDADVISKYLELVDLEEAKLQLKKESGSGNSL